MQKFRRTAVVRIFSCMLAMAMVITGMAIPKTTALAEEQIVYEADFSDTVSALNEWQVVRSSSEGNATIEAKENSVAGYKGGFVGVGVEKEQMVTFSHTVEDVAAGTYTVSIKATKSGTASEQPKKVEISVSGNELSVTKEVSPGSYGKPEETVTDPFTITEAKNLTITVTVDMPNSGYMEFDDIMLSKSGGDDVEEEIDRGKLKLLLESVPQNYEDMNFTDTTALKTAIEGVEECLINDSATGQEMETAYKALLEAISNLVISDDDVFVEKIASISDSTIRGMDVSSYLSIMDSFDELNENKAEGEKLGFKDFDGKLLDRQGFFDFLAGQGVNYIRLRVWNDPYDADGNGYGGGNNDLAAAKEMGKYASNAGMSVLIDFHYSDFWADPFKQQAPKEWRDYTVAKKADAISDFTETSIDELVEAGVNVAMVQIGNETNGQICGENSWANMNLLFDAGCDAVHKVAEARGKEILAAIHFTNPETAGKLEGYAKNLADYDGDNDGEKEGVSYDVFATSYYPYWHGSLGNLNTVLTNIAKTYGKYVMVAETSYGNTLQDTDGHENTLREGNNDKVDNCLWMFTNQGQINEFRDVLKTVTDVDVTLQNGDRAGLGVFYWEGAWIAVQNVYDENGELDEALLEQNKELWEKHGSGWASSYAAEYDPDDAGNWFGGSAVDNQAFFGADGVALSSIKVYNPDYLKYGAVTQKKVDGYAVSDVTMQIGETVDGKLGNVTVVYNDGESQSAAVIWNPDDIASVNAKAKTNQGIGNYMINGVLEEDGSFAVKVKVTVVPRNLLVNPGFEEDETAWTILGSPEGSGSVTDGVEKKTACVTGEDPHSGVKGFHFYCKSAFTADAEQSVTVTEPGTYAAYAYVQGAQASAGLSVSVSVSGNARQLYEKSETVELDGWNNWKQPTVDNIIVTQKMLENGAVVLDLRLYADGEAEAWGTWDDAYLYLADSTYRCPTKINVAPAVINLTEGSTERLAVSFEPEGENATECLFTSSNEAVAVVSADGTVTGKKEGKATIRVTSVYDEDVYGEAQVTVTKKTDPKPGKPQTPVETTKPVGTTAKTETAFYKVTKATPDAAEVEFTASASKTVKSITIPDAITIDGVSYKVTSIADNAFKGNKKLTTVKLGNNITNIGKNAFSGCTALKSLTIPKNVTTIGSKAFNGCKNLKKITVKSTVLKKVGSKAFKGINAKAVIKVPKKQLKTYQKLLKGKGQAKTVKIK